MAKETQKSSLLMALPPEIREEIYRIIFDPAANRIHYPDEYFSYNYKPALVLFRINRQIYVESRKIFRDLNVFVRIETQWPEAQQHVSQEGHVPILIPRDKAPGFQDQSLTVTIDAPQHPSLAWETQRFIIHLDDLKTFTRMWYYSDLTHPNLNGYLRLTLTPRAPYTEEWEEKRMTKAMQKKLLLPFGEVRNLQETKVAGEIKIFDSVKEELFRTQAEPHRSPESCLREAAKWKAEGNVELAKGNYEATLELYDKAWLAMHVVIKGRKRHIHGDAFFNCEMTEEPYKGKNGLNERLILRVILVANTCQTHLKMEQWEQCKFWGMRTINTLREAIGIDERASVSPHEEALLTFPAASQMGKIYYRTAVACKHLDDLSEARKLLKVAKIYLAHDPHVSREIAATALKLG